MTLSIATVLAGCSSCDGCGDGDVTTVDPNVIVNSKVSLLVELPKTATKIVVETADKNSEYDKTIESSESLAALLEAIRNAPLAVRADSSVENKTMITITIFSGESSTVIKLKQNMLVHNSSEMIYIGTSSAVQIFDIIKNAK